MTARWAHCARRILRSSTNSFWFSEAASNPLRERVGHRAARTSMDPGGALLTTQARLKLSFALSFFRLLTGLTQPHERDRLNRAGKGKVMRIGSNG